MKEVEVTAKIGADINSTLRARSGLIPFCSTNSHDIARRFGNHKHCMDCSNDDGARIIREALNDSSYFTNELFWLLFLAFAEAEASFVRSFIPQNCHEERLTGHLVSELTASLKTIRSEFENMSVELYGEKKSLDFIYHDLSANRRERITGADLALCIHIDLPDFPQ